MITELIRLLVILAISMFTGVLGIIWLFGDHASIFVTIGVKPLGLLMLAISFILFEQLKREVKRLEK